MNSRLKDKVAIITGGSTGIGEAISHKFSIEGAKIIVNGLESDPVDDVVRSINNYGGKSIAYKGDISEEKQAKNCVERAIRELKGLRWGEEELLKKQQMYLFF